MIRPIAFCITLAAFASSLVAGQTAPVPKPAQRTTKAAPKTGQTRRATRKPAAPARLETDKQKASYAVGMNVGKSLAHEGIDIDPEIFLQGVKDIATARDVGKDLGLGGTQGAPSVGNYVVGLKTVFLHAERG